MTDKQDSEFYAGPDGILEALVAHVNKEPGTAIPVTIAIPGATVTGDMAGLSEWLEGIGSMSDFHRGFADSILEGLPTSSPEEDNPEEDSPPPRYVHVVNARFVTGGTTTPYDGMYWRARLIEVTGWTFGRIGSEAEAEAEVDKT